MENRESSYAGHLAIFLLLWLLVHSYQLFIHDAAVLTGVQVDTDGYMRLVRVGHLWETGAWFDSTLPRSNWPFGEIHHWTRPLDVLIILLALPLLPFVSAETALLVSGSAISPVLHLAGCVAAIWTVRPLVPGPARFLAPLALLIQPGFLAYGTAGRADHHALVFLLVILVTGAAVRLLEDPRRRGAAVAAGALSALGVWVTPEFLLPLGLVFAAGGIAWVVSGERYVSANVAVCSGLVWGLVVALVLERSPAEWLAPEYDRISIAHVTMSVLALSFWIAVYGAGRRIERSIAARGRAAVAAVGGAAAVALLALAHPAFFRGPWVDVDPRVVDVWLQHVSELRPLFPARVADLPRFLLHFAPAVAVFPYLAWRSFGNLSPGERARPEWLYLLVSLGVYVPLASYQLRFSAYAGIVFAIALTALLRDLLAGADAFRRPLPRRLARLSAMVGVIGGGFLLGGAASAVVGEAPRTEADQRQEARSACALRPLAGFLADPVGLGSSPRTIAAFIDFGPELLYRTPHRILAGPYHRNAAGIVAAHRLLTETDEARALGIVAEREVGLILLCPPRDAFYFSNDRLGEDGGATLYDRLREDDPPSWVRPVQLPDGLPEGFLLFEVAPE